MYGPDARQAGLIVQAISFIYLTSWATIYHEWLMVNSKLESRLDGMLFSLVIWYFSVLMSPGLPMLEFILAMTNLFMPVPAPVGLR